MEGEPPLKIQTEQIEWLKPMVEVRPLVDDLVEKHGFGPRSNYVEICWLGVLGPTATWLYRRLGSWAELCPESTDVDLVDLAVSLGLGEGLGRTSKLAKGLDRLVHFDAARWDHAGLGGWCQIGRRLEARYPQSHRKPVEAMSTATRRKAAGVSDRFRAIVGASAKDTSHLAVRRALAPLPERQARMLSLSAYQYHQQMIGRRT